MPPAPPPPAPPPDPAPAVPTGARVRHLVPLLLALTVVTGLVDAVSYLALGRVFVANMTGNVVLLGFAWAGDTALSAWASVAALVAFLLGAVAGGELARRRGEHRGNLLTAGAATTLVLLVLALGVDVAVPDPDTDAARYVLVVVLGVGMGVQSASVRALAVADATTTVLTMTLTGLAADSRLAGARNPRVLRRLGSVAAMLGGALVGGLLVLETSPAWALGLAAVLVAAVVVATASLSRGTAAEAWQVATPAG